MHLLGAAVRPEIAGETAYWEWADAEPFRV